MKPQIGERVEVRFIGIIEEISLDPWSKTPVYRVRSEGAQNPKVPQDQANVCNYVLRSVPHLSMDTLEAEERREFPDA